MKRWLSLALCHDIRFYAFKMVLINFGNLTMYLLLLSQNRRVRKMVAEYAETVTASNITWDRCGLWSGYLLGRPELLFDPEKG